MTASSIELLVHNSLNPALKTFPIDDHGEARVNVKLIAGIGRSLPKEAGWYVICNGRVVLEADTRPVTGWGHFDEDADAVLMPRFHNQFARFRGIAIFRVPILVVFLGIPLKPMLTRIAGFGEIRSMR